LHGPTMEYPRAQPLSSQIFDRFDKVKRKSATGIFLGRIVRGRATLLAREADEEVSTAVGGWLAQQGFRDGCTRHSSDFGRVESGWRRWIARSIRRTHDALADLAAATDLAFRAGSAGLRSRLQAALEFGCVEQSAVVAFQQLHLLLE
jgi:hypothetical protein